MSGPLALLRGERLTALFPRVERVVRANDSRHYRERPILHYRKDHGTRTCYMAGCRCDACTDAESLYSRERKRQRKREMSKTQLAAHRAANAARARAYRRSKRNA